MKATGIVRRMDDLGRVVIPKEIRKTYKIKEGDPIEIFINSGGELVLKKHSPVRDLSAFSDAYADALAATSGYTVLICDTDSVISAAGAGRKEYIDKGISVELYKTVGARKNLVLNRKNNEETISVKTNEEYASQVIAPILSGGDIFGAVVMFSEDKNTVFGINEQNLCVTAAAFLGSQVS